MESIDTGGQGETMAMPDEFSNPEGDAELQEDQLETTDSTLRKLWDAWLCQKGSGKFVAGSFFGRNIGAIPQPTVDAYMALEQALRQSGYRPKSAWSYNCRKIAGSSKSSLHSYGIAIDLDPSLNPYSHGDRYSGAMKRHHVAAALAIKNPQGASIWSWGGNWRKPDRMHFQIDQGPDRVSVDWSTVPGADKNGETVLTKGTKGQAVAFFQKRLIVWDSEALAEYGADGDFGSETVQWIRRFQDSFSLPTTGSIDGVTASLLVALSNAEVKD